PTQLAPASVWNRIVTPTNDTSTYRTDNFVVFTLPLAGLNIPPASSQRPVLILKPGFQVTLDYQSPNGQWYSYSFLQGNNATNTWITAVPSPTPGLCLATTFSKYNKPGGYSQATVVLSTNTNQATLWSGANAVGTSAVAQSPMFAKA